MPLRAPASLTALARRWLRDRRGAIAPMFAIAAIPLLIASGVGIDVSRMVSGRNNLQDALDATSLALARMPANSTTAQLKTAAQQWMTANLTDKNVDPSAVALTITPGTGQISIDASSTITTTISALAGMKTLPVTAHSVVKWGMAHVELVLVLDNTGSMADDNKLQSLKDAASTLVTTLSASAVASGDPQALKIGVVPFSIAVNVGSKYRGSTWLTGIQPVTYGADVFTTTGINRFTLLDAMGVTWGGCVEDRPMPYDVQDTAPAVANPSTLFVPFFAPDEPDDYQTSGSTKYGYGNDYLDDLAADKVNAPNDWNTTYGVIKGWQKRQGNPLKYTHAPNRTAQAALSPYPVGPNSGCGIAPLLRMTTDMSAVNTELTQMVAYGNTHIPLGLVWGWHLLSPNAPFADGSAYGAANVMKIVVLVTDGENTYNINTNNQVCKSGNNLTYCTPDTNDSTYTGLGYKWQNRISQNNGDFSNPAAAMNDRLGKLCSNMQTAGVTMYTVPLEVTDTNIKTLLQGCASGNDKYLDVASSSDLAAAFANIAGSISNLRVSH